MQVTENRASPENLAGVKSPAWRQFYDFMKEAIEAWVDDYAPSMGAALSYYTVFSLAPLLLIVISVAGLVFGEEAARGEIFGQAGAAPRRRRAPTRSRAC